RRFGVWFRSGRWKDRGSLRYGRLAKTGGEGISVLTRSGGRGRGLLRLEAAKGRGPRACSRADDPAAEDAGFALPPGRERAGIGEFSPRRKVRRQGNGVRSASVAGRIGRLRPVRTDRGRRRRPRPPSEPGDGGTGASALVEPPSSKRREGESRLQGFGNGIGHEGLGLAHTRREPPRPSRPGRDPRWLRDGVRRLAEPTYSAGDGPAEALAIESPGHWGLAATSAPSCLWSFLGMAE